jgi:ATP-dependent helicase/DNAse subunit B
MLGGMSLSVIFGPPNSGRAAVIRARLEAALDRDPVLVVPTADDVARAERELSSGGRAILGAAIRTFAGLTGEIAAATGAAVRPLLTNAQRLAVVRATIRATPLRALGTSAARAGFAPALEHLIGEFQAALIAPESLARAAGDLGNGEYETELARLYRGYVGRREAAGRDDTHSALQRVTQSLLAEPHSWGGRPVLVYGFDDLTEAQLDLVAALASATEVTVAVNYADREALAARAELLARLRDELGADHVEELPFDPSYTESATLRELDSRLYEVGGPRIEPDAGIALLECGGERGEAEAIGGQIARLLAQGVSPDDVVVVLRHPDSHGPLYREVLGGFGIPVAVEASVPLSRTAVGRGVVALARCAQPDASAADLLDFLRAQPGNTPQRIADRTERRIRREQLQTAADALANWSAPPAALARLRDALPGSAWLRELAATARRLAEEPHAGREPVAEAQDGRGGSGDVPFEPLETRAALAAASTLEELADLESLPGCAPPAPAEAIVALEDVRVRLWGGPSEGRVRVLSPYRVRAARARHLFVASLQDGEFPGTEAVDPLLGDERRTRLALRALARRDATLEERYLFHACVSRPTEQLWLSWRSSDEEGRPTPRSPFVDDVLDLLGPTPERAEKLLVRQRGLDRVVFPPREAPNPRELARSVAVCGPRVKPYLPGPLASPEVLAELARRNPVGAGTLEKWIECPYRWFVDHELSPQRLEPTPEPMTAGSVVHEVLERLYKDPPGGDRIPRPDDIGRWRERAAELLAEVAEAHGLRPNRPRARIAIARMKAQIERLLERESRSETDLRPALFEASFDDRDGADRPTLDLGDLSLHGQVDRADITPDGRYGLVYDYKTGSRVWAGAKLAEEGKLQLQLYARALRDQWGIEPLGGLYYRLGGSSDPSPRGFVAKGVEGTDALDLTRTDRLDPDQVAATVEAGVERAREKAAAMRRGEIGRDPNRGICPDWCRYQAICRLERSIAAEEPTNGNGGDGS